LITPSLTITYTDGKIVVTDTTVYGGANPTRENYNVNYTILYKGGGGTEKYVSLNDYDEVAVSEVFGTVGDGRYLVTMTVTGAEDHVLEVDELIYDNLTACLAIKKEDFINSTCCQEDTVETFEEYSKVKLMLELIQEIEASGKGYNKAQCILEYAFTFCRTEKCICGC